MWFRLFLLSYLRWHGIRWHTASWPCTKQPAVNHAAPRNLQWQQQGHWKRTGQIGNRGICIITSLALFWRAGFLFTLTFCLGFLYFPLLFIYLFINLSSSATHLKQRTISCCFCWRYLAGASVQGGWFIIYGGDWQVCYLSLWYVALCVLQRKGVPLLKSKGQMFTLSM